jgi:hypothetical protein
MSEFWQATNSGRLGLTLRARASRAVTADHLQAPAAQITRLHIFAGSSQSNRHPRGLDPRTHVLCIASGTGEAARTNCHSSWVARPMTARASSLFPDLDCTPQRSLARHDTALELIE